MHVLESGSSPLAWGWGGVYREYLVSLLYGNLVSIVCFPPPLLTLNFLKGILLGVLTGVLITAGCSSQAVLVF